MLHVPVMCNTIIRLGVNVFTGYVRDMSSFTTLPVSNSLLVYLNNKYKILYDVYTTSCEIFISLFYFVSHVWNCKFEVIPITVKDYRTLLLRKIIELGNEFDNFTQRQHNPV